MPWLDAIWDDGDGGNVQHIAEHGTSRTTGRPLVKGRTPTGRWIVVIYEPLDAFTVMPITAYEDEE